MDTDIKALFARNHLRTTTSRMAILQIFKEAKAPLSPVEITKINPAIDKVSVYRTIEVFTKIGLTTRVAHGWKERYELASPFRPHHHHLLCNNCGAIEEIQSDNLEKMIDIIAHGQGFEVTGHTFEINGLCRKCKTQA
ncbi:MAG TPA: Fur family transcriptional regulator [Candidatus Saccharimonadales bacterium]|nr:Fur family transcriptional regulator [Candidatus Saccharimonadales bacterium]